MNPFLRQVIVIVLTGLQCAPPIFAANIPRTSEDKTRVGILRLGDFLSESGQRAYPIVERRVQHWLDNFGAVPVQGKVLGESILSEQIKQESEGIRISQKVDELWKRLGADEKVEAQSNEKLFSEIKQLRGILALDPAMGPIVSKALVAEAAYHWKFKNLEEMTENLKAAVRISPDGRISPLEKWDLAAGAFDGVAFDEEVKRTSGRLKRNCAFDLRVQPSNAKVLVNGFAVKPTVELRLANTNYFLSVSAPGHVSYQKLLKCDRQQRGQVAVNLKRGVSALPISESSLAALSERHSTQSLFLIEPQQNEFKLYWYTPGHALEEIPLKKPLLVADVLQNPAVAQVPIQTDAFLALYQRHQGMDLKVQDFPSVSDVGVSAFQLETSRPAQWYNSWVFWTVTGALAGGVLITLLASRHDSVGSNGGVRINLQ